MNESKILKLQAYEQTLGYGLEFTLWWAFAGPVWSLYEP